MHWEDKKFAARLNIFLILCPACLLSCRSILFTVSLTANKPGKWILLIKLGDKSCLIYVKKNKMREFIIQIYKIFEKPFFWLSLDQRKIWEHLTKFYKCWLKFKFQVVENLKLSHYSSLQISYSMLHQLQQWNNFVDLIFYFPINNSRYFLIFQIY